MLYFISASNTGFKINIPLVQQYLYVVVCGVGGRGVIKAVFFNFLEEFLM